MYKYIPIYPYTLTHTSTQWKACFGPEDRLGVLWILPMLSVQLLNKALSVALGNQHSSSSKERIPID